MWGNEFPLWAMKANRDIMSLCLNRPTGCMIDCHWMINCICQKKVHSFYSKNTLTALCVKHKYSHRESNALQTQWWCPMQKVGGVWHGVWLVEACSVLAAFDSRACQRFRGTGLSRCLPHTCHAFPPWWALQLCNQQYYCLEMYIFNLWNNDSFAWFMAQGKV